MYLEATKEKVQLETTLKEGTVHGRVYDRFFEDSVMKRETMERGSMQLSGRRG